MIDPSNMILLLTGMVLGVIITYLVQKICEVEDEKEEVRFKFERLFDQVDFIHYNMLEEVKNNMLKEVGKRSEKR